MPPRPNPNPPKGKGPKKNKNNRGEVIAGLAGAVGGAAALKAKQVGQLYRKNAAAITRASDREYRELKTTDPKSYKQVTRGNQAAALRQAAQGRSYTGTYASKSGKMTGMKLSQKETASLNKYFQKNPPKISQPPRTGPSSGGGGYGSRWSRLTGGGLNKHGR